MKNQFLSNISFQRWTFTFSKLCQEFISISNKILTWHLWPLITGLYLLYLFYLQLHWITCHSWNRRVFFSHDTFAWAMIHLLECSSIYVYQNPTHPFNITSSLKTFLVAHEGNLPFRTSRELYLYPSLFIPHLPYINQHWNFTSFFPSVLTPTLNYC